MESVALKFEKDENYLIPYNKPKKGVSRNGFEYLKGAEQESKAISAMFSGKNIDVNTYSGTAANEESFRTLSGNSAPSVIHLSTHGFYFPDTITNEKTREMMKFSAMGEQRFRIADDPLLRSGLIMAGGNLSWRGEKFRTGWKMVSLQPRKYQT